jgi:mannose-1-phosphate guanylyltransferase
MAAHTMALKGYIVTLGISPNYPAIGFGYIERGDFIEHVGQFDIYHSSRFVEKPDLETAVQFLTSGRFSWNSGMFIWRAKQAFAEFERQQPDMYKHFESIVSAYGTPEYERIIEVCWPQMTKLPIDYAIMEGAKNVAVIPVDIGWSDIGSWSALYDVLADNAVGDDRKENILRGTNGTILSLDTSGTLVYSNRKVVTIGVSDIVIVDTDDVLLVCHRDHAQDVRKAVNHLRESGDEHLL